MQEEIELMQDEVEPMQDEIGPHEVKFIQTLENWNFEFFDVQLNHILQKIIFSILRRKKIPKIT